MSALTPIFLISLPRSGSTFLQKILMSHPDIASTAEPWFLLPLCYMQRKPGVFAEYGHPQSVNALRRIDKECGGGGLVDRKIAGYAMSVYGEYCTHNERFFLDKTPRYYWIAEELVRIFPDVRFVVLLRNPLSVFASSIEGLSGNSVRRLDHLERDFSQGPERIGEFVENHRDAVHVVKYEELVTDPENCIRGILEYLNVQYMGGIIENSFKVNLPGPGDHLGARQYSKVTPNLDKWKKIVDTPYRKARLISYLKSYPDNYLRAGGYNRMDMLRAAKKHRVKRYSLHEYIFYLEELLVKLYKKPLRGIYG